MKNTPESLARIAALAEHLDTLGDNGRQAAVVVRDVLSILRGDQFAYHGPIVQFAADLLDTVERLNNADDGPALGDTVVKSDEAARGVVKQLDARRRRVRIQWKGFTGWERFDSVLVLRTADTVEVRP